MYRGRETGHLFELYDESEWRSDGAFFWDWLIADSAKWGNAKYKWIGSSLYGDQISVLSNSPLHEGSPLYILGPDLSGPAARADIGWPECLIYLGPSIGEWLMRVEDYGDEYSIAPGDLLDTLGLRYGEYVEIYRSLNPGLAW